MIHQKMTYCKINFHPNQYIKIFNASGQLVRILAVDVNGSGVYEVVWDGRTDNNDIASSGTYFYIVDAGQGLLSGKMTLLK